MRRVFRLSSILVSAPLLAALVSTCRPAAEPVVIGAVGPWHLPFVRLARLGVELAVEEINRTGGIGGRRLEVVFRNDSADAERAASVASDFVADRRIVAVLGNLNSGAMLAAARVFDGKLAAVAPTAASPELSGISRWVFRVITNDSVFGIALGRYASRLGRRAAVLYDNNSFGRGGAQAFHRNYRGTIVSSDPIRSGDTDLGPFAAFYQAGGADLVFVAGVAPSGLAFLRVARRQGFRGAVLGTDSWVSLAGDPDAEGAYIATRFSPLERRPEVMAFVRAFRARFGLDPDGFAAFCYDATRLVARALERGGMNRRAVRDYLASLDEATAFPGVTGAIRFTPGGDPVTRGFTMLRVQGGRLALVDSR